MKEDTPVAALKFRTKPIIIEAIQLTPELFWELFESKKSIFGKFTFSGSYNPIHKTIIHVYVSLGEDSSAELDDWIIKEGDSFFHLTEKQFERTYETLPPTPAGSVVSEEDIAQMAEERYPKGYTTSGNHFRNEGFIAGYKASLNNK